MEDILMAIVKPEAIVYVTPVVLLLLLTLYKEWPDLQKRVSAGLLQRHKMEEADASLEGKINVLKDEVRELNNKMLSVEGKLATDFARINRLEQENDQMRKIAESSLEERQILMHCNLAQLKALRDMGANGHTGVAEAQEMLQNYLNLKAHNIGV